MDLVFYKEKDGALVEMRPQRYDSEGDLQALLADHPYLLGGQSGSGVRLLLIAREQGVPGASGGADRWSLDHLFVDDAGVPTLVEVKRSSDTRIRREVVGQMLDYAANGVSYWPEGSLRVFFERTVGDPERSRRLIAEHLQGGDVEAFWTLVEDNLRAGRLRLVFVADEIPDTLRRIIEFLNEQMDRTEVIGVEVQQYRGGEHATLVPRVIGRTTTAERQKAASQSYDGDLASGDPAVRSAAGLLDSWAEGHGFTARLTPRAKQYLHGEQYLFQYYPMYAALEVPISRFRSTGRPEAAARLREEFQALSSQPLSHKHLYIPARDIVDSWEQFASGPLQYLLEVMDELAGDSSG